MSTDIQQTDIPADEQKRSAILETLAHYASLSSLLRTLGGGIVIASISMFLFKGWATSDDIERYVMLLVQTLVLAAAGVVIGYWLRESKGARLFLSLSLIAGIVNYTVLGGLIYSCFQWDGGLTFYPQFATWRAASPEAALTVAGIGWALLLPVAGMGFLALARRSAVRMTTLFVLSGSALMLPVRETAYIAVLAGGLTAVLLYQVARARHRDTTLATPEGRFARLILFAVPILMVGRGMYLYAADTIMVTTIAALVFLVLRQLSGDPKLSAGSRAWLDLLSVFPALGVATGVTALVAEHNWLPEETWIPMFVVTGAALLLELSMRAVHGGAGYRRFAGLLVTLGMLANLYLMPGVSTALISTAAGLVFTVMGYSEKQRVVLASGLVTFLSGVAYQCYLAFRVFDFSSWTTLAVIGILVIVTGSVLERHGAIIRARLGNWRQSFLRWQN